MQKIILSLITTVTILTLTACGAKITQTADTMTAEKNTKLEINLSDFFEVSKTEVLDDFLIDTTKVDMSTSGTYDIIVAYKNERYNIILTVQEPATPIEDEALTPVTNVDRGDASGNVITDSSNGQLEAPVEDVFQDEEYDIFNHIADHVTYTRGATFEESTYTISQELLVAIYDAVPQLSEYPKAYQDDKLKAIAKNKALYDSIDDIIDDFERSFEEYDEYSAKKYGPVGNHTGVDNTNTQQGDIQGGQQGNTDNQQTGGNTATNPTDGTGPSTYFDEPTVTINGYDGPVTYTHTGEYIDGKAVYVNEYGKYYHINTQGGLDRLPDNTTGWDDIDENGANFTDHIRN